MQPARQHIYLAAAALLFGLLLSPAPAPAATTDAFLPAGHLIEARDTAKATLQKDGTVLVTGGYQQLNAGRGSGSALDSAEVFDTATNQFTAVGPMTTPRVLHGAVRLQDGRVSIAGGYDGSSAAKAANGLNSAELFDPSTRTFTATGKMHYTHEGLAAALLPDGRALLLGGQSTNTAELFDPTTGKFRTSGVTWVPCDEADAVPLADGRVVVLAGGADSGNVSDLVEMYDPRTGVFTRSGHLVHARSFCPATLLPDGRILVAGGGNPNVLTASIEIYDPATQTSTVIGNLMQARENHIAALLPDGRVLVAGGRTGNSAYTLYKTESLASAEIIDPATGAVSPAAPMATARTWASAVTLQDGRVLILGGYGTDGASTDTAEIYVPAPAAKPGP